MNTNKDGGQAFPISHQLGYEHGMSLRDYFAANALPEILREMWGDEGAPESIGVAAYQIADSMLAARKNTNGAE